MSVEREESREAEALVEVVGLLAELIGALEAHQPDECGHRSTVKAGAKHLLDPLNDLVVRAYTITSSDESSLHVGSKQSVLMALEGIMHSLDGAEPSDPPCEEHSGEPSFSVLRADSLPRLCQYRKDLSRVLENWPMRKDVQGDAGEDAGARIDKDFVLYLGDNPRAVLDGRTHALTVEFARILERLASTKDPWLGPGKLKNNASSGDALKKAIARMPDAVRELIESKPGQQGGRRLLRTPKVVAPQ